MPRAATSLLPATLALLATLQLFACGERNPVAQPDGGTELVDFRPHGTGDSHTIDHTIDARIFPDASAVWTCGPSKLGIHTCLRKRALGGLPPTGTQWQCHLTSSGVAVSPSWLCHGLADSDPSGGLWSCTHFTALPGPKRWRCTKPDSAEDRPPQQGPWVCVKGDPYGGTRCQRVPKPPQIPPSDLGGDCVPGQKRWCDNALYDGWSTVDCDPATSRWRIKSHMGKPVIDCSGPTQSLPLTMCARYHFFFNPACCERQDCVVPEETSGQPYMKSSGEPCAFCNPLKSACTAPGAQCLVTNAHETFCGELCTADADCAGGGKFKCMTVKLKGGTTKQCVPSDLSCYF